MKNLIICKTYPQTNQQPPRFLIEKEVKSIDDLKHAIIKTLNQDFFDIDIVFAFEGNTPIARYRVINNGGYIVESGKILYF